ncbi:hypothetical protein SCP_1404060 [Sparassis crispa]|uniref:Uncharacterized protein n=1 Tax=Sparassis crispa TaxID=139825 RepID=A0A401H3J2_9APHY|nr:hypothetical protein SCP_1404060 [Sparassis crispa]GBE88998.1 hypothetical protein SCP_1404060 [Sparassis crispa]
MLGAAVIWMANALVSRPGEWKIDKELSDQCSQWYDPEQDSDDDDDDELGENLEPVRGARGVYFLSDIRDDRSAWRLPGTRLMEQAQLLVLYGASDMAELSRIMGAGVAVRRMEPANKRRMNNRTQHTLSVQYIQPDPDPAQLPEFRLRTRGFVLRPEMRMRGLDVLDGPPSDEESDIDRVAQRIWRQFPNDLIQVSPNYKKRSDGPYTTLTRTEQDNATAEVFLSFEIPFREFYVRYVSQEHWDTILFDRFFPPKGYVPTNRVQNQSGCKYYAEYVSFMNRLNNEAARAARQEFRVLFNQLAWVPNMLCDRIWTTKPMRGREYRRFPPGSGSAPQIALNPHVYRANVISIRAANPDTDIEVDSNSPARRDSSSEVSGAVSAPDAAIGQHGPHINQPLGAIFHQSPPPAQLPPPMPSPPAGPDMEEEERKSPLP